MADERTSMLRGVVKSDVAGLEKSGQAKKGSEKTSTTQPHFAALEIGGDDGIEGRKRCPEENASWFGKLTYTYVDSLMKTGAKKHLEHDDLWDVNRRDEADTVYQKYRQKLHQSATQQHKQGVVWRSLFGEHGRTALWTGILKVAHDIVMFAPSFLLEQLLHHVTRGGSRQGAFFWACMLLFSTFLENITINIYFHALFRMSLHIKIAMIQLIYDKSLRITNAVRAEMGTGAISNLQSNDAAKIWGLPMFMHVLWNGPFQILVVMGMLVRLMGWFPALAGFAVTVVMIPLTTVVGKALAKVRRAMVQQTDARVKLASEIITGMKAIKLYAWEKPYADRLLQQREKELKSIRKTQTLQLVSTSSYQSGPVLVALAAFSVHYLQGKTLTAAIAFPALSLFNLLRFPIIMLPTQIMSFVNARVSLQRIQKYLEADEMVPRNTPNPELKDNPFAVVSMVDEEDTAPLLHVKSGLNGNAKSTSDLRSQSPDDEYVLVPGKQQANESAQDMKSQQQHLSIRMRNGTFSYEKGKDAILKDVSMSVKQGQLVMVVGQVGSGKSSLLSALLGEMHRIQGKIDIVGSVAYTAQDPWIQNTTLRKNVLMGNDYDHEYYTSVLAACALGPDLEMLQAGDATEIGEKGVNLSGGQKHRVALARAAYADADVYLLDDPLSAVDAHVGRHLFEKCICGLLAPRTRILVTHQLQFLPAADVVIVMSEGGVKVSGTYQELLDKGVDLHQFVKETKTEETINDDEDSSDKAKTDTSEASGSGRSSADENSSSAIISAAAGSPSAASTASSGSDSVAGKVIAVVTPLVGVDDPKIREEKALAIRAETLRSLYDYRQDLMKTLELKEKDGKLTKVEQRAVGQVDRSVYKAYISAWSKVFVLLPLAVVFLAFAERGLQVGQNYVLTFWTNDTRQAQLDGSDSHPKRWLTLYFTLGMLSIGMQFLRGFASIAGSISASRSLHKTLMDKILRLPMSFYDSQPTGRLLNRMTKDTEAVDVQVSGVVNSALTCAVNAALAIVVVAAVTPIALMAVLPLGYMYYVVQTLYIASSRELKRLDSLAFSPIFQHFGESLAGLITIRAFDKQGQFRYKNQANINHSNRAYWPIQVVNRWLSVRLEMMGAFIVFITAVSVSVIMPSNPGLVGLAITSALNLTGIMNWMVRQVTELEINMNSVERLVEYLTYDEEAPAEIEDTKPPAYWPQQGAIEAKNLTVKYRPELDPVLKGLSFTIRPQEKIGVCGRTGCGKSTLMITLYRLIEPCAGTIYIDGVDIMKLGLRELRSRLSLVPQDPVIFSGTIRSNLDPFNAVDSDDQIWAALRRAGMEDYVKSLEGGLKASIKEGGSNLSVGQRQLLCMARALLRASRILVLDEATSNVDNATDSLIQTTIRTAFPDCTTLTIAHRLHTIIDSDRILVLDAGQLQEFDSPHNLLKKPESTFRKLVEETSKGGGLNAGAVSGALAAAIAEKS